MQTLTIFHLDRCPYCRKLTQTYAELCDETPEFRNVPIEWVEESKEPQRAEAYSYWYVPTIFLGNEKLFETKPSDTAITLKAALKQALETAKSR